MTQPRAMLAYQRPGSELTLAAGLGLLSAYRLPESQEIYETLRWPDIARTALRSTGVVPEVLWRCSRMRRRWPWSEFDAYRDRPLNEIRDEYGIEPVVRR